MNRPSVCVDVEFYCFLSAVILCSDPNLVQGFIYQGARLSLLLVVEVFQRRFALGFLLCVVCYCIVAGRLCLRDEDARRAATKQWG